jgi:hypothetical protein
MRPKALFLLFLATFAWAGVPGGVVGSLKQSPPQPVIRDLRAVRKGNKVTLTWTQPHDNGVTATICRAISSSPVPSFPGPDCTPVGQADAGKSKHKTGEDSALQRFSDTLDEKLQEADPPQFAIYRLTRAGGSRPSGSYSNSASVSLAPVPQVKQLHSSLDQRGVYLIWEAAAAGKDRPDTVEFDFRLWRQEKGTKAGTKKTPIRFLHSVLHQDEGERWGAVDDAAEYEKTYDYWLTPVTRVYSGHKLLAEFEGEESGPLEVVVHDVFPPATPEGLLAVASEIPEKKFVDLIWSPNAETDIAGYNIYRREEGEAMARIGTAPRSMLSYQDTTVSTGRKYFYAISAVDLRGNESRKTPETDVVKP